MRAPETGIAIENESSLAGIFDRRARGGPRLPADSRGTGCTGLRATGPLSLLTPDECQSLVESYAADVLFRSRVIMARHGFGPWRIQVLHLSAARCNRGASYGALSSSGRNRQSLERGDEPRCSVPRRTPRLFETLSPGRPAAADAAFCCSTVPATNNCLHADLYGEHVFPLQATVLLSKPGARIFRWRVRADRAAPAHAIARRGRDLAARAKPWSFRCHHRPVQGTRGIYRVNMRHGVSRIREGPPPHARIISTTLNSNGDDMVRDVSPKGRQTKPRLAAGFFRSISSLRLRRNSVFFFGRLAQTR